MQFELRREQEFVRKMVREFEKENKMDFTIKAEPFSWNDNFSEVAREDFSMIQKDLSYCTAQNIGMALAKLELLENQGCEVVEQKHGQWEECDWVFYDGHGECVHIPEGAFVCTNCRHAFKKGKLEIRNYCTNCGAKMVKGQSND
jgi:DNA-directed RNA polymerase subunit RPC12/RpoP